MKAQPIIFIVTDDNGVETQHTLPTKFEVCSGCEGHGTHVNPAIDGNGISVEQFADDPDFEESYFAGDYDITCETCKGLRVVPVVDQERCDPALLEAYNKQQDDDHCYRAMVAAEERAERRAMGNW